MLVGDDPASDVYVRMKRKACAEVGIESFHHELAGRHRARRSWPPLLDSLNADPAVSGILLQLPLPAGLDADALTGAIDPGKDVDGLTPVNAGLLAQGAPGPRALHARPGVMELLADARVELRGAAAVVIGRSQLVGKPLAQLLLAANATVTQCHSRTRDLAAVCRGADVLVAAVGRPGTVTADMVREGAVVIDVGTNRTDAGLVGDVDFEAVAERAGAITPVPGGVGPMTIAMLLSNTARAARLAAGWTSRRAGVGCRPMDLRRLRAGEWIAGGAGVVLLVSLFLPWYGPGEVTALAGVRCDRPAAGGLAAAAIALVPVTASQRTPSVAIAYEALLTLAAMVGVLIVLLRVINLPAGADAALRRRCGWRWRPRSALVVAGLVAMRDERRSDAASPTDATGVPGAPRRRRSRRSPRRRRTPRRVDLRSPVARPRGRDGRGLRAAVRHGAHWYSTIGGDAARQIEELAQPRGRTPRGWRTSARTPASRPRARSETPGRPTAPSTG